ncbi:minor capsid protein [Paenibacillus pasadenensis]|uniref:ADP-ribosyltransferase n=1 Tax=Paenibacillus pasadenensis TaxID=217090 RepID=UPI00203E6883|nr:ADP-ribosyltransferase [Paenibacillus pasadenensis]MCM3747446.1 minor capsid protein [Paenibacillus pasadenensis]
MKPASYWEQRTAEVSEAAFKQVDAFENVMLREYTQALDRIKERMAAFYGRYATNDGISLTDARKQLTGKELTAHRMTLEEFTAKAKANTDGKWTQELNRASFKARVSRLEALELQVRQEVEVLAASRQRGTGKLLGDIYEDTYYKTGYELQRGLGIGTSFARINKPGLDKVLGTEFAGSNWSKRIWGDRDKLVQELRTKMSQAFIRGEPLERLASEVSKRMEVSLSNARRLVQTESAFFTGQAAMDGYKATRGVVKAYKIVATLDRRTSDICQDMDGQVFKLEEMRVGETYPPFHSHCRTATVAEFDNAGIVDLGKRLARDDDGSVYKVPSTMKYPEWKQKYLVDEEPEPAAPVQKDKRGTMKVRQFTTASDVAAWNDEVAPAWIGELTSAEEGAVKLYSGSSYSEINRHLRQAATNEHWDRIIESISTGLQKFPLREAIEVYRGLSQNVFGTSDPDELVGMRVRDMAFMSTSLLPSSAFGGQVKLVLRLPPGTIGAPIQSLSDFPNEFEFLLDKGTEYEIIEALSENGKLTLIVEVIPDEGQT